MKIRAVVSKTLQEVKYEPIHIELEVEQNIDDKEVDADPMDALAELEGSLENLVDEIVELRLEKIEG